MIINKEIDTSWSCKQNKTDIPSIVPNPSLFTCFCSHQNGKVLSPSSNKQSPLHQSVAPTRDWRSRVSRLLTQLAHAAFGSLLVSRKTSNRTVLACKTCALKVNLFYRSEFTRVDSKKIGCDHCARFYGCPWREFLHMVKVVPTNVRTVIVWNSKDTVARARSLVARPFLKQQFHCCQKPDLWH